MPTPEIAFEGVSSLAVAAATCEDIAATSDNAVARLNDPQTNLYCWVRTRALKEVYFEPYLVRRGIQSFVADPNTAPKHETMEEANVSSSFLLTDFTPTAASIVG